MSYVHILLLAVGRSSLARGHLHTEYIHAKQVFHWSNHPSIPQTLAIAAAHHLVDFRRCREARYQKTTFPFVGLLTATLSVKPADAQRSVWPSRR